MANYKVDDYQWANYTEVSILCVYANSLLFVNINANGIQHIETSESVLL